MVQFWENAFRVPYNKDHEWVLPSLVVSYELGNQDLKTHLGMEGLLGMNPNSETFPDMEQSAGQCFGSKGDMGLVVPGVTVGRTLAVLSDGSGLIEGGLEARVGEKRPHKPASPAIFQSIPLSARLSKAP